MSLIIDGYNLLYASGILGGKRGRGELERARGNLLRVLADAITPEELPRTIVVFDAGEAPWGAARVVNMSGIRVQYASQYEDADELIEELILADSAPKKLTVVSSDHRLHRAAKRRKATPVDSDRWFGQLLRARQDRARQNDDVVIKPEGPLSDFEIQFWLKQFGVDPQ